MVAALKKLTGGDFAGRFSAWWDGRDYAPPTEESDESATSEMSETEGMDDVDADEAAEIAAPPKPSKPKAISTDASDALSPGASRIAALETLWGEGRFGPGSAELSSRLTDALPPLEGGSEAQFGLVNGDPALLKQVMAATGACPVIAEWRVPCASRFREEFPDFEMVNGDLDRPPFEAGSLQLVVSLDAFAYSDHKSGLAVRMLRSLAPGGQWVVIDTMRGNSSSTFAPAFASSWCEPQLIDAHEVTEVCESAGFELVSDEEDLSGDLLGAARQSFSRFGESMGEQLSDKLSRVNRQVYMRELGWEVESWKWRQRALASELIQIQMWKLRRPAE